MTTSKEVFAKRREGAVDEAYRMALELMGSPNADEWDKKAFCWCLIDIIKRDAGSGDNVNLAHYRRQLESVEADPSDEILAKGVRNALSLCNPGGREISRAKALSWDGKHAEAAAEYRKALAAGPVDRSAQTKFGWTMYFYSKELMAAKSVNFGAVKHNLNDYLKLDIEKPSDLHSRILQLAAKLAGDDKLSMLAFSRLWNLDYLRPEDFERFRADDGKEYPSLAEKVIQQVGKEAATSDNAREQEHVLPRLDAAIERFPDNVWLKLDKAKVLLSLGMHDKALAFSRAVAKAKPNDYWAWSLLGDIVLRTDGEAALGCYCKALSCPAEDKFTGKTRLKAARLMLEKNELAAAKLEVETVARSKESEGHRIPEEAAEIASQPWFAGTSAAASNRDFYKFRAPVAEALVFGDLQWFKANVGERFSVSDKEGKLKKRRMIFLETSPVPTEAIVPESKLGRRGLAPGDAIRVKGEFADGRRFNVFALESRESGATWDVFPERKRFCEEVRLSNGMGFTESGIFIAPPMVSEHRIEDGQSVSGTAVLSFNKKRGDMGWKAVSIEKA